MEGEAAQEIDKSFGLLEQQDPLEPSSLGEAVDALLLNWSAIWSNTGTKYPSVPTADPTHYKEVAAVVAQEFRESCRDVNAEFAKVALEWELENGPAAENERVAALRSSIERQQTLLARASAASSFRLDQYEVDGVASNGVSPGAQQE